MHAMVPRNGRNYIPSISVIYDTNLRTGVPHTIAKLAICYCTLHLAYIIVPGLSSHFLLLFHSQPTFAMSAGQQYVWEMAIRFRKLRELTPASKREIGELGDEVIASHMHNAVWPWSGPATQIKLTHTLPLKRRIRIHLLKSESRILLLPVLM